MWQLKIQKLSEQQVNFEKVLKIVVPEVAQHYEESKGLIKEFEKISFSMLQDENLLAALPKPPCKIFLWGVLAEACILQTALDALNLGYEVNLVDDGITSLSNFEKECAFQVI